ncbi:KAP family P-loop NTPase fold protein [Mucilaginibacter ginsenosidivorans]|uniref:KAP NTPase domain-containing protein n=1 Tax=Mucilaginibacter ginsenosidivorans TaxID=398053 RepID=A0A5B8UWR6_9SPHI|nr:P-loop NTPase fold protein [Mucilaginibacter ginsenosidivorans]QEC62761.1 hypothetical protein FRZ54_09250 [Mucilaginibacter ginsenosidivorans]
MNIKHQEIEIPPNNPFKNCKLGRRKYGELLTDIVETYSDGFVISIDNQWGSGKTTFVKMWKQHLENEEFKTLYFNAWVNDFDGSPLIAILSELRTIVSNKKVKTFDDLLSKGAIITKNVLPGIAKAIAKKYIDMDAVSDAIEEATKSAAEILKDDIDEYLNKKNGLIDFKVELADFIQKNTNGKPLIFIVDELDRCRPNYAVEILENIKHFFSVKGIVFVLSIDKAQLGNAIKGFYGSDLIDSNEYLRRFIDIEYHIPEPDRDMFTRYLCDYYEFDEFFNANERKHRDLADDKNRFLDIANILFESHNSSLRQQEKIVSHARVTLNTFPKTNYIFPDVFVVLIFLRDMYKDFYWEIRNRKLTPQQFVDKLQGVLPPISDNFNISSLIYLAARIINFYHTYYQEVNYSSKIIDRDEKTGEKILLITSLFPASYDKAFLEALDQPAFRSENGVRISYLLNKIDLLENFLDT